MLYALIYVDENGERKWQQTSDIETAEKLGRSKSDNNYDVCVSLYEHEKLKEEAEGMRKKLAQVEQMCRTSG